MVHCSLRCAIELAAAACRSGRALRDFFCLAFWTSTASSKTKTETSWGRGGIETQVILRQPPAVAAASACTCSERECVMVRETGRCLRVYGGAPGFRPGPSERETERRFRVHKEAPDLRRHQAFALAPYARSAVHPLVCTFGVNDMKLIIEPTRRCSGSPNYSYTSFMLTYSVALLAGKLAGTRVASSLVLSFTGTM